MQATYCCFMLRYIDSGMNGPDDALGCWLEKIISDGITSLWGQFGFFDGAALRPFSPVLQAMVEAGGSLRLVIGANVGDPPSIENLEAMLPLVRGREACSLTIVALSGALFHPKTLQVVKADGSRTCYVGSSNFTRKGLGHSVEAGLILEEAASTVDSISSIGQAIERWATCAEPGVFQIRDESDIAGLSEQGLAVANSARVAMRARQRSESSPTGRGTRPIGWRPTIPETDVEEDSSAEQLAESIHDDGAPDFPPPATHAGPAAANFAMLLAQFDVSHRTGVKGTPEMSLPGEAEPFFGPLGFDSKNRKHAGRHFFVEIEMPAGASTDEFRAWRREAGEGGNADFRLRVSHALVDLTDPNGGDILHVIKRQETNPEYRVRLVRQADADYSEMLNRCDRSRGTGGAAGQKKYGIW